jgi:hypothetical protein
MYKMNMTRRALGAAAIAMVIAGTAAFAQQASRIRGQIEKVDGAMLSVKMRDGSMVNVKIADDARVAALVKASLADIKTDTFMGIGGVPQADGSIQAFSIHIFLPAQRGKVPDRATPWDARPGSTMTNAYVQSIVTGKDGETVMVKFNDGEKKVVITPQTGIAAVAPGSKDELKAGMPIIVMTADKQPDGSALAKVMYFGRGIVPPM